MSELKKDDDAVVCQMCGVVFAKSFINRHINQKHGIKLRIRRLCCPLCKEKFNFRVQLRTHIVANHQTEINEYSFQVDNWAEFVAWRKNVENTTQSRFFRPRSSIKSRDGSERSNFYCQYDNSRDWHIMPYKKRRRALKSQGSCKITGCCPAEIIVIKSVTGMVNIQYFGTHIGHDIVLAHFHLSHEYKPEITGNYKFKNTDHVSPVLTTDSNEKNSKIKYLYGLLPNNEEECDKFVKEFSDNVEYFKRVCTSIETWKLACQKMNELISLVPNNKNS